MQAVEAGEEGTKEANFPRVCNATRSQGQMAERGSRSVPESLVYPDIPGGLKCSPCLLPPSFYPPELSLGNRTMDVSKHIFSFVRG